MKTNKITAMSASNSKRPKILSPRSGSTIFWPEFDTAAKCVKVFIRTFGCQANVLDSQIIAGMLKSEGYVLTEDKDKADIILFNTCSVRKHAEDRVWGNVGMLKKCKVESPAGEAGVKCKVIGIVGCMAKNYGEGIFKKAPNVNLVCGPANIYELPRLLDGLFNGHKKVIAIDKEIRPLKASDRPLYDNNLKAFVRIMEGCNNFCSYCIVPYVRGREISRPMKDIVDEVKSLVAKGYKEVMLLGQNVNSYKADGPPAPRLRRAGRWEMGDGRKSDFVRLLEEINKTGIECVRFMTSHPKDANTDLFRAIANLKSVCKHLHLPLQSGSDRILKLMNRRYTSGQYLKKINSLRKFIPNVNITTDIIVGFPGETEKDFLATKKMMEKIKFDSAFIFKYSPRPPAKSSFFKDDVEREIKEERNQILIELQRSISKGKGIK